MGRKDMTGKRGIRAGALSFLCALFFMAACSEAAEDNKRLFFLSPTISGYIPVGSRARDAFGSSWWGLGVSLNMEALLGEADAANFSVSPYFGLYHGGKSGSDAWIIPVGVQVSWRLYAQGSLRPYAGIGVAGYGIKLEEPAAGADTGWKGAFGGRLVLGTDITRWFNVEAAYNVVSDVEGYDFSGFSLQGKLKIYF
jgi:hypothetical protein